MPRFKLWLIVAGLAAATVYFFWYACRAWLRSRVITDTPTSRVRSAAQGYVELCGRGVPESEDAPNKGPLSGMPCAWWRYKIEQRVYSERSQRWSTVRSETSTAPFLLDDGTGRCLVDPRGAEVVPSSTHRWYGPTPWPQGRIPGGSGVFGWMLDNLLIDKYRYTEHRLELDQELCAIGAFRSLGGVSLDDGEAAMAALLHAWKQDRAALLARFDADHDGNISAAEWERAREAARRQVRTERAVEERRPTVNVLSNPDDGRAFLLAASDGATLATRFRRRALAALIGFVAGAAALTWLIEHV